MPDARVLRIGIDAREALGAPTGVGRYLVELLRRWAVRPDRDSRRFVLYVPASRTAEARALLGEVAPHGCEVRAVPGSGRTVWEQVQLPLAAGRDRLDVFFAPAYTTPLALRVPAVVAIHDVSYLAHPEWFPWRTGVRRRWITRRGAARAARVVTCSQFSRGEIVRYAGISPGRIEVTHYGFAASPPGPPPEAREPLVLFAGSIFNRRHVDDLIRAFAGVVRHRPGARLIIAGEDRTYPHQALDRLAEEAGVADRVEFRAYVSDSELRGLYARARVFGFLSEYEGFGMTPLEALAAGVPIVAYDTPVAREVYDTAAVFVAIGDIPGVATAIGRLLDGGPERDRVLSRAPAALARYSWDRTAEATLSAIERAARGTRTEERGTADGEPGDGGGRACPARTVASAALPASGSGAPALSIVIVSYNARDELERCLRSLAAAPPAMPYEIVVVDSASPDGSAEAVRAGWPGVHLIAMERNAGFAAACNAGIRAGSGELVLLLNGDTVVPAGAIDCLVARLRAHPDAAAAGPRLVDGDGFPELSFGRMIAPFAELRQKLLVRMLARRISLVVRLVRRMVARESYVDWVSGACLLVWRTDAEAVGLLDERFFLYTEDVDFCARLRAGGRRVLFTPASEVVHLRGRSRATSPRASDAAYRRSQLAFYAKHHPRWTPWLRLYLRLRGRLPG